MPFTGVVNNSNIGDDTAPAGRAFFRRIRPGNLPQRTGLPLKMTTARAREADSLSGKGQIRKTFSALRLQRQGYDKREAFDFILQATTKRGANMAKITFQVDRCKGCGLCVGACPKKLIRIATGPHQSKRTPSRRDHRTPRPASGCAFCATMCPDCVITVER